MPLSMVIILAEVYLLIQVLKLIAYAIFYFIQVCLLRFQLLELSSHLIWLNLMKAGLPSSCSYHWCSRCLSSLFRQDWPIGSGIRSS